MPARKVVRRATKTAKKEAPAKRAVKRTARPAPDYGGFLLPGPPPVRQGEGAEIFTSIIPEHTVSLDNGAFRAAWEALEANYVKLPDGLKSREAAHRAIEAFRNAYHVREHAYEPGGTVKRQPGGGQGTSNARRVVKRPIKKAAASKKRVVRR